MALFPTPLQLRWQAQEFGMFCHFGINTFYGKEWSDGTLSSDAFNPAHLDARQWAETAKAAGMRYLVFTAKHHDGFCLWPTATTDYSVRSAPFRGGQGDVVGEVARACQEAGLHFGLYLSPWDRHEPCYLDPPAYDDFYVRQLTELCTRYGPLFEVWFDGAGSEGRVYNWNRIMEVVDRYQPQAMVFNMGRPTIRWVGNEDGLAADPNPYVVDDRYLPPECDVPIRQNWFWQADDAHTLKSLEHLLGIYYRSIGYGANLLLNIPPNNEGLLDELDRQRLLDFSQAVQKRFAVPIHGVLRQQGSTATITFDSPATIDHLVLQENLEHGQVASHYQIIVDGSPIAEGFTIGNKKIDVFPAVEAREIVVVLDQASARLSRATAYQTGFEQRPELETPGIDQHRNQRIG